MADNNLLVTISGAALSLLLYENVRSNGDQVGLLFGNVLKFVTKNVTDYDRPVEQIKHHVSIDTVMTFPGDILLDCLGRINKEILGGLVANKEKNVIGWFRFRRHNSLTPSMRDKIIHKEISSHFLQFNKASPEHFIMLLLNASTVNYNNATHKYRHVCLQYIRRSYQPVSLRINNLGDDAARHDGSDYKPVPRREFSDSDVFTELINRVKSNTTTTSSANIIKTIQDHADVYLDTILNQVCKSDEEISILQRKVDDLHAKIKQDKWERHQRLQEKIQEKNLDRDRSTSDSFKNDSPRSVNSEDLFDCKSSDIPVTVSTTNSLVHPREFKYRKGENVRISKRHESNE